ncbi:MAG: SDR family oxidoreductase [Candidatus Sulfotelmatobacter sp.]
MEICSRRRRIEGTDRATLPPRVVESPNSSTIRLSLIRANWRKFTEAEWDEVLTVNLKSVFLVTQAVVGGMGQRKWGRIINLSSVAAQTGGAVGAHYAASKAGIIGLTHSCASVFVREGITVNAIAPALIETDMVTSNPDANPTLIPMGHFGSMDDVASVAVMLAMNDYMTGQTISVNGGWYMS